ncbi:MAG: serine/threonine-protein kinase, partial [Acidobacteriota bacterium]
MNFNGKSQLGHYRILSQLGAGGMGEVFLAEDTRLERKVALKLLPEKFSADSEPLNRFKQEAKAASALNHPNIITVYEIGECKGTNFIVTEFIDGKTLRERMKDRLTFDEILSIVIQTSEALSAAHQAGIVHRDIKPENIMIRPDGYVKVLDFGLAKLIEQNKAEAEDATRKLVKTSPGVVMGTVAYMSPEQARGKDIDARSDVFSFGIVLYEMLAGKVPFAGETMTDVLAAI